MYLARNKMLWSSQLYKYCLWILFLLVNILSCSSDWICRALTMNSGACAWVLLLLIKLLDASNILVYFLSTIIASFYVYLTCQDNLLMQINLWSIYLSSILFGNFPNILLSILSQAYIDPRIKLSINYSLYYHLSLSTNIKTCDLSNNINTFPNLFNWM